MHRQPLLSLLKDYLLDYPEEAAVTQRFISFVQGHSNCFSRSLSIGHVTGSAWLVSPDLRRVLLTHHRRLDRWLQLGGHADGDADVLAVAMREAEEESGIVAISALTKRIYDLDIHPIPARKDEPAHFHYDVRFALLAETETFTISEESHDLQWLAIDRVSSITKDLSRMADKWLPFKQGLNRGQISRG